MEAESFAFQRLDAVRRWELRTHPEASGGRYLELVPDTRRTHDDKLTPGENFTNEPGTMAVLEYRVRFPEPGRYYIWVRALSIGTEDNSIHAGLNGQWPESGRRIQFCDGKHQWWWESRQRTEAQHCGEEGKIYLDVASAGEHTVMFSMREDGFRFDAFLLTKKLNMPRPQGGLTSSGR